MSSSESSSDLENSSDEELQQAFAEGSLKPGLNAVQLETRAKINDANGMTAKVNEITLKLGWVERLDIINEAAPMAPELALQVQEEEDRRGKQTKGNKKLTQYKSGEDPILNDFVRETMFHRQAQAAAIECLCRIKKLGIPALRPDDYFAEMCKTDEHMHKIREKLAQKQLVLQRSEKVRQLRQQRKIGKQMQIETTLKKHAEKRKMLEEVKNYRKGTRKDLNFLNDKKKNNSSKQKHRKQSKNKKFGYGGKKRNIKKNTKDSSADF